jgi:hypothetical protein
MAGHSSRTAALYCNPADHCQPSESLQLPCTAFVLHAKGLSSNRLAVFLQMLEVYQKHNLCILFCLTFFALELLVFHKFFAKPERRLRLQLYYDLRDGTIGPNCSRTSRQYRTTEWQARDVSQSSNADRPGHKPVGQFQTSSTPPDMTSGMAIPVPPQSLNATI